MSEYINIPNVLVVLRDIQLIDQFYNPVMDRVCHISVLFSSCDQIFSSQRIK